MATTYIESGSDATQDLSFFTASVNNASSDTGQQHTGPRSLKLFTSNPIVQSTLTSMTGIFADAGSQFSFWFFTDTTPTGSAIILRILNSATNRVYVLNLNTNMTLNNAPFGATAVNGSAVLTTNTWYRICVSFYITNTTTFGFNVYVNGVLDSTANAGTLTNTGADRFIFFAQGSSLGINASFWFDDIYIATGIASSSSQPDTGDIRVTAKRPNANGTVNNFTLQIGSGGSGYGSGHSPQVNEQPLSTTNGWSIVAAAPTTEEYNVENAVTGDVNISKNPIVDYLGWVDASSVTSETAQIIVSNNTSGISLTSTATIFIKAAGSTTYPAGTGTDIGVISDATATTVGLYECGIVLAFSPATSSFIPKMTLLGIG